MRKAAFFILLILMCINSVRHSFGQQDEGDGGQAGEFLRYGVGGRALAMGGAYGALANDATACIWNPAGISQMSKIEIYGMKNLLTFGNTFDYIGIVLPLKFIFRNKPIADTLSNQKEAEKSEVMKHNWVFGGGYTSLTTGEYEERDNLTTLVGKFSDHQDAIYITIGYQFNYVNKFLINLGLNATRLSHAVNLSHFNYESKPDYGIDFGLIFNPVCLPFLVGKFSTVINEWLISPFRFGLSYQNINEPKLELKSDYTNIFHKVRRCSYAWSKEKFWSGKCSLIFVLDNIRVFHTSRSSYCNFGLEFGYFFNEFINGQIRLGSRNLREFDIFTLGTGFEYNFKKISDNFWLVWDFYYRIDEKVFSEQCEYSNSFTLKYGLR